MTPADFLTSLQNKRAIYLDALGGLRCGSIGSKDQGGVNSTQDSVKLVERVIARLDAAIIQLRASPADYVG
jgi:hypothetical protein